MPLEEPPIDPRTLTQKELLILMDGKLNVVITSVGEHSQTLSDHEARLRTQEHAGYVTWKAFWVGIGAVGTLTSALASLLTHLQLA